MGLGIAITAASGAYFSASETMPVAGNTAHLGIMVNGAATDKVGIKFPDLAPGQTEQASFTVTNTGNVAADVTIGTPIHIADVKGDPALLNIGDISLLSVGVENYQPMTSITSSPSTISLGQLAAGATGTYTVDVKLDSTAGNDWQSASASGTVTVALEQSH